MKTAFAMLAGACLSVMLAPSCAAAQETGEPDSGDPAATGRIPDITVTAQRRAQSVQSLGIAITALSATDIATKTITTSAELAARVVGMQSFSAYGPGTSANVVIRGIGLNDFGEGHEAPVTTNIDDLYVVAVPAADFALFDLDRVEVLRGPQGTLAGRNATGGAVNYITARPTQTPGGFVTVDFGSYNTLKVEAATTAVLTPKLSLRISGVSHHSDGYQRNLTAALGKGAQYGTDAARVQLRYQGDDDLDILFKGEYGRINTNQGYYETITGSIDPASGLVVADPAIRDGLGYAERATAASAPNVANSNEANTLRSTGYNALLRVDKGWGATKFTSITGYQYYSRELHEDSDGTPNPVAASNFPYQSRELTEELRLFHQSTHLRWTIGALAMHAIGTDQPNAVINLPDDPPTAIDATTGLYNGTYTPLYYNANWRLRTDSLSAYAQAEHDIGRVTLIGGARITYDDKAFRDADNASLRTCGGDAVGNCALVAQGGNGIAQPFSLGYSRAIWSGKVEADYKPAPGVLLYASISRGSKAGAFNNGFYPSGIALDKIPYRPESVVAYEAGEKITALGRKLRINTSGFFYDYSGYQTFNYDGIAGTITNRSAYAYGVESELQAAITPALAAHLSGAYLKAVIKDVSSQASATGAISTSDRPMAFAPKWMANGGLTYTRNVGQSTLIADWNFDAVTTRYSDNFGDPGVILDGYFKHNASIVLKTARQIDLKLYINNIGDRQNRVYTGPSFAAFGIIQVKYAQPRTVGVGLSYHW